MKKFIKTGTARERAAYVLLRLHDEREQMNGLTVQTAMEQILAPIVQDNIVINRLSKIDNSLCTELTYGCLRNEISLRHILNKFLKAPDSLPKIIYMVLLVASYEILLLDKIPDHASINSAVVTIKKLSGQKLASLANAVLRNLARLPEDQKKISYYTKDIKDEAQKLSLLYSIPQWIIDLWINDYGLEMATSYAEASTKTPYPCVRLNKLTDNYLELKNEIIGDGGILACDDGIRFLPGQTPSYIPKYIGQGLMSWQGAGSQNILQALKISSWTSPVWDACAGRGGKSTAMIENGLVVKVASDPNKSRIKSLTAELKRLKISIPELIQGSSQSIKLDFEPKTILLDVPCSGLGTLSRRPDAKLNKKSTLIENLTKIQRQILEDAWEKLASGGRLVYLTCTLNKAENENQIETFLKDYNKNATLEIQTYTNVDKYGDDILFGAVITKN